MIKTILVLASMLVLAVAVSSCGGSSPVAPIGDEPERILGIINPSLVPQGIIAYTRALIDPDNPIGYNKELFLMLSNGANQIRITNNPADDDYASFSPKGLTLAFVSNRNSDPWGNHDVYRMITPSNILQLTHEAWQFNSSATDWGPGFITAAQLNTLIGAPFDVVRVTRLSLNGISETWIDTGQIASYEPCLSKDGRYLFFAARPAGATYFGSMELYQKDLLENTPAVQLTSFGKDPDNMVFTTAPAMQPDGVWLAFQTTLWDGNWEIGKVNLASMAPVLIPIRVTENKADDLQPTWDPSGNWIAFCTNRDGNYEIYKQYVGSDTPPGGKTLVRLTKTPENESNPDWSPSYVK